MEFYLKILNGLFLCCHEQMKKHLEAPSRCIKTIQTIEKKRVYFVHWCMKILAKRKRGNKFPLWGKCHGRPTKERASKRGNKFAFRSNMLHVQRGRKRGKYLLMNMWYSIEKRKLPFEGNHSLINRALILIVSHPKILEIESFSL